VYSSAARRSETMGLSPSKPSWQRSTMESEGPRKVSIEGRLVARKNEKFKPIQFWQATYMSGSGFWLTMGADYADNVSDSITNEQNAVGLISALLLTINSAYLMGVSSDMFMTSHGWPGEGIDGDNNLLEPAVAYKAAFDVAFNCQLIAFVFTLLSTLNSIFVLLVNAQMTGPTESTMLLGRMGLKLSFGFFYFGVGLITTGVSLIIHIFTLCTWMWSSIIALGFILLVPVTLWLLKSLFPLVYNMYAIKAASYNNSPTHLTGDQIERYVGELIEKVGVYQLTESLAVEYLTERFRKEDSEVPVTFTIITQKSVSKLVEAIQDEVVSNAVDNSALVQKAKEGSLCLQPGGFYESETPSKAKSKLLPMGIEQGPVNE